MVDVRKNTLKLKIYSFFPLINQQKQKKLKKG